MEQNCEQGLAVIIDRLDPMKYIMRRYSHQKEIWAAYLTEREME